MEKGAGPGQHIAAVKAAVVLAQIAKDISLPGPASLISTESNFLRS